MRLPLTGPAYRLPAELIDGNDVVVVRDAAARAVDRARTGGGPTVVEARTYRHFGHSRTDPGTYRPAEEVREWLARDPLAVARDRLSRLGVPDDVVSTVDGRVAELVAAAVPSYGLLSAVIVPVNALGVMLADSPMDDASM